MTDAGIPNVDGCWKMLNDAVPAFDPDEQRVAVVLYRELAKGEPVPVAQRAKVLYVSVGTPVGEMKGISGSAGLLQQRRRPSLRATALPRANG